MSSSIFSFLICIQVLGKVIGYSFLFKNFPQFAVIHTVKGCSIVNELEVDVFLELSSFFSDSADVDNSISGSSAFSKSNLNIWKFSVYILLKPGLENFEHYIISVWDECNCVVVWAFFGIAFLWDWNENWPFPTNTESLAHSMYSINAFLLNWSSLEMEWKLIFSSPVATAEFSKFADILRAALSQHHLSGFEIAQLEFHHLH